MKSRLTKTSIAQVLTQCSNEVQLLGDLFVAGKSYESLYDNAEIKSIIEDHIRSLNDIE